MIYRYALTPNIIICSAHLRAYIYGARWVPLNESWVLQDLPTLLDVHPRARAHLFRDFISVNHVWLSDILSIRAHICYFERRYGLQDSNGGLDCIRHAVLRADSRGAL